MYTYHHVIRKLTETDKVRLLTDIHSLSSPELERFGIPRVSCIPLQEGLGGEGSARLPSPKALARSWSRELMAEVAEAAARGLSTREGGDKGGCEADLRVHGHILLPPVGSGILSDGEHLSEDPRLSCGLSCGLLEGVTRGGLTASAMGYGFVPAQVRGMDTPPSPLFTERHMRSPYRLLAGEGKLLGVILENSDPPPEGLGMEQGYLLRRNAPDRETVLALGRGELLIKGSAPALQGALHTYRRLKNAIAHGKATAGELRTAIQEGEAISEEAMEAALDRLLTFAARCCASGIGETSEVSPSPFAEAVNEATAPPESEEEGDSLSKRALDGATVLLENRGGFLPLRKPGRLCLIGDLARWKGDALPLVETIQKHGHTYLGFARGYDPARLRDDALTEEAIALATEADVILAFFGTEEGKSRLPAAQMALLSELGRLPSRRKPRRLVVILSSEAAPDMGFVRAAVAPIDGLLLTPLGVKGAPLHAVETLLGDRAPMGHLTETLIDASDPAADRRGLRIGPFVGYRYYDTIGCGWVYPFGHGLSYGKFRYSFLKVSKKGTVTFGIRNVGKKPGVAVPQVYVGRRSDPALRPRRELVSFAAVPLAPGQKTRITLSWIEGEEGDIPAMEKGVYRISVGESIRDIRLSANVTAGHQPSETQEEPLYKYLPTVTNIHTERYVMEADYTPMRPSIRNLLFGIAALLLAGSVKLYDVVTSSHSLVLNIVAGVLVLGAVIFFIQEILDRKKQFARERAEMEEANARLFTQGYDIPYPSAEALFRLTPDHIGGEEEGSDTAGAERVEHFLDVDQALTFPVAMEALTRLSTEKGQIPQEHTVRDLFAAMASTRLLVTTGMKGEAFAHMISLLGEFFGCKASLDTVDSGYTDESALFFGRNGEGELYPREAQKALEAARRDPRTIHILALDGVSTENISEYFVPYARYARAPHSACTVTLDKGAGEKTTCHLPENLWLVLNLREGEKLSRLPDYITEVAAVLKPAFIPGEKAENHTELPTFRYGQMLYLVDRLKAVSPVGEDTWKCIDRLEAYAARLTPFALSNKLWLGLESFMAVLMTVESDTAVVLDEAMAARLMPALVAALSGKLSEEEQSLSETLDAVFGDGNTTLCHMTVKESEADLT